MTTCENCGREIGGPDSRRDPESYCWAHATTPPSPHHCLAIAVERLRRERDGLLAELEKTRCTHLAELSGILLALGDDDRVRTIEAVMAAAYRMRTSLLSVRDILEREREGESLRAARLQEAKERLAMVRVFEIDDSTVLVADEEGHWTFWRGEDEAEEFTPDYDSQAAAFAALAAARKVKP